MTNPLLEDWDGRFGLPPFDKIRPEHFRPAFEAAMAENLTEIETIVSNVESPSFENTVEALERAGHALGKIAMVFFNLSSSHTNPELQEIEREIAPKLAVHQARVETDPRLWARIKAVIEKGGLGPQEARVTELYRRSFVRSGADLSEDDRARMSALKERLAGIGAAFSQNVLKDEADWVYWLDDADVVGLPNAVIATARVEAVRRGGEKPYALSLSRSLVEPFLTFSPRRDLREIAWRAWTSRGETTNWELVRETIQLRAERARLLGFANYAELKLADQMAKTPNAVRDLLHAVWRPAKARAMQEAEALQSLAASEGQNITLEPWDWRYYSEKERKRAYDIDEAEIKPYLALDSIIAAAFAVAERLFRLTFEPVSGLALHHPDARAWDVRDRDGAHLGLFIGDYFARPSKRSGAWMSAFRQQQKLREPERPIIMNNMNFAEADPALLSWDDARTLFHEFGHALHGLMSDVTYPSIAGTSVARDFVELPSQLYEHWLASPEILAEFARHHETGAQMPDEMIEKIKAAETFNQGFSTVEYTASALVDLAMHELSDAADFDGPMFERQVLGDLGLPREIVMRHRTPHFQHVFAGDGYAAGYYSYMWSEVMDADAFHAFEEAGDLFDPETARRLATEIYSAGGQQEPEEAYLAFRGAMPGIEPLLEGRGLIDPALN